MKKFTNFLRLALVFSFLTPAFYSSDAQVPQALNYQAVARNASGYLITNQLIGLRFSILSGSATGTVVYTETQFANTNQLSEGSGSGDFGKWYPDYRFDWELKQIGTNGLCALDIVVRRHGSGPAAESQMTTLLYLPKLQQNGILKGP